MWQRYIANYKLRFNVMSLANDQYNCFAYSMDVHDRWVWWETTFYGQAIRKYVGLGYRISHFFDVKFSPAEKKVALYFNSRGQVTHAAVQNTNGMWESKVGEGPVVEHESLECLESPIYGKAKVIMVKPRHA